MRFQFASCDRRTVLGFLRRLYPGRTIEDSPESAGRVLDYVAADVIRVLDPDFHGANNNVVASVGWESADQAAVIAALQAFHKTVTKEPANV